jgi:hypothetical protein
MKMVKQFMQTYTSSRAGARKVFLGALLALGLVASSPLRAQTYIDNNNLISNGGFDSSSSGWSQDGGGAYYYSATVGSETSSILSLGWWNGVSCWQNTGNAIQPATDYVLSIRALVGSSPLTGVAISLQDVTTSWTVLDIVTNDFPDQTETWRVYSLYISSNTISGNVGDTMGVGGAMIENPSSQYGWIWVDWMQLQTAVPYFTNQPVNVTNYAGASASLSVPAAQGAVTNTYGTGPGSILYQWYKTPSAAVTGATNTALTFAVLNATNAGTYYCVATGPFGSTQSSNATLTVLPANPPIVSTPPASRSAYIYQTVQFTVAVAGSPPFHYQWSSPSGAIAGATNATLTLTNISAASAGTYSVTITNQFGSISTNASLTVITPVAGTYEAAVINLQPQVYLRFSDIDNTNWVMNEGTFGAAADATAEGGWVATTGPTPSVGYPNLESTNPAVQFDGSSADVAIPPLDINTNTGNAVTMSAWIYCYGEQAPYSGVLFERGGDASGIQIQVDSSGNNILSYDWGSGGRWQFGSGLIIPQYQWCFVALVVTPTNGTLYLEDGTNLLTAVDTYAETATGLTGDTYVGWDPNSGAGSDTRRFDGIIDEVTVFDRSLSFADVSSLYYAATGQPAGIVSNPVGLTNYTGQPFSLSVVASGAPPLSYQWYKNSTSINGATKTTYAVASASTNDSGSYYVYVKNTAGNTNSAAATVLIKTSAPFFTEVPAATNLWSGVASSIAAQAAGSGPLNYQWFLNGVALAGQTNASLFLSDPEATGDYVCQASNSYGTNTTTVLVTVADPNQSVQMLYYTNTTTTWNMRNDYQPIQGVWFQTGAKARVVTHVAYFDSTGTGLETNHWVGIFQGAPGSGTLLASAQVMAGTTDAFYSGYRWAPLNPPFVLQANTNYVLAASDNNWDLWPDAYTPNWNSAYVGDTSGSTRYPMYDSSLVAWPHEPNISITSWGLNETYGIFNFANFPLTRTGSQLSWTMGTLMSSTNVAGPYTPVSNATSPYTMPLTGHAQFYLLQY